MAAASYTTDLTLVNAADVITNWVELSGHTSGGAPAQETDYFIQGSACVSQSTNNKTGTVTGLQYDFGSDITLATDDCFFFWSIYLAANAVQTYANGGIRLGVGSSAGNMDFWNAVGSDFGRYPYGGWQNIAIDPTFTADATDGTPAGTYRFFGSLPNIVAGTSKGNPHAVDIIRYGRGELIIEFGDLGNGYGTFAGVSSQNDNQSNRWGLLQTEGAGYLWKGLMSFGNVTNACDFRDSNVSITIDDTPRTYTAFNSIEFNNASSRIDWTGVNITAVNSSQISKGVVTVDVSNPTVNLVSCVFTDMAGFILDTNTTVTDTVFRRCDYIDQFGATFNGCTFDSFTNNETMFHDDIDVVTNSEFISDGSNHGLYGFGAAGDYTLVGLTFTNYAVSDGSTGNEAIQVTATTGTVNLFITGGGSIPSIRTNGATVNVIQTAILTVGHVRASSDVWIYRADNKTLLSSVDPVTVTDGSPIEGVQYYKHVYSYNASVLDGVATEVKIFNLGYVNERINYTLTNTDARIDIQQRIDRNYLNP